MIRVGPPSKPGQGDVASRGNLYVGGRDEGKKKGVGGVRERGEGNPP